MAKNSEGKAGKVWAWIFGILLLVISGLCIFFTVDNWDTVKPILDGYIHGEQQEEKDWTTETMSYEDFKAEMVADGFIIIDAETETSIASLQEQYPILLDSIALKRTGDGNAEERTGSFKYEVYAFYGTNEEAKVVELWSFDYDLSKYEATSMEEADFAEYANELAEGLCNMILDNSEDAYIETFDGEQVLYLSPNAVNEMLASLE